jgi:ferredoxin
MDTLHTLLTKLADPDEPIEPLRLQAAAILTLAGTRISGSIAHCERCEAPIYACRDSAKFCSNACRVGAFRVREREKRAERRAKEKSAV